jgi:hypothetical protein
MLTGNAKRSTRDDLASPSAETAAVDHETKSPALRGYGRSGDHR